MPDIFGREPQDYETLRVLREAEGPRAVRDHILSRAGRFRRPPHDFNALGRNGVMTPQYQRLRDAEPNAQAVQYMVSNIMAVRQMTEEILYQEDRVPEMLMTEREIPAGAAEYSYRVVDLVGQGAFIEAGGSNAPTAGASQTLVPYPIARGGIVPTWTLDDIRTAMFSGLSLTTESLRAGLRGAMNHIEQLAFTGSDLHGTKGLINHADVTASTATAAFSTYNGQQLVDVLNGYITKIIDDNKEIIGRVLRGGFTIYLPTKQFGQVTTKRISDGNDLVVWGFLRNNNHWREQTGENIMIRSLVELKNQGSGSTDRMIIGLGMNKDVLELAMSVEPQVIQLLEVPYGMIAPIEYKVGPGISMKRPDAIQYIDGV